MANEGEDKRDPLFDMSVGDGFIEVNTETVPAATEETAEEKEKREKEASDKEATHTPYEDGSFEIADAPSTEHKESASDAGEFFENTEEKKETKKTPSTDGSSDSSSSSPYLAFARDRAKEGVFLEFNDEDWATLKERNEGDEAAALRELSDISIQARVNQGVEDYEAKEKGLPLDEYSVAKRNHDKYSKVKVEDLSDDEKLQEDVVTKFLELRGFTSDEIKEEIEGYKALEKLGEKAEKALDVLPKTFKKNMDDIEQGAEAQEQSRQDGIRQRVARMKKSIDSTPEIIPGINLTKPAREKIMKSMTIPIAKDEQGNPLNPVMATRNKNSEAFEMMLHYYHGLGLFNIDDDGNMKPDFSKIAKVEQTKATDTMRSAFETTGKTVAGKTIIPAKQEDELDEFEKAFRHL